MLSLTLSSVIAVCAITGIACSFRLCVYAML